MRLGNTNVRASPVPPGLLLAPLPTPHSCGPQGRFFFATRCNVPISDGGEHLSRSGDRVAIPTPRFEQFPVFSLGLSKTLMVLAPDLLVNHPR